MFWIFDVKLEAWLLVICYFAIKICHRWFLLESIDSHLKNWGSYYISIVPSPLFGKRKWILFLLSLTISVQYSKKNRTLIYKHNPTHYIFTHDLKQVSNPVTKRNTKPLSNCEGSITDQILISRILVISELTRDMTVLSKVFVPPFTKTLKRKVCNKGILIFLLH